MRSRISSVIIKGVREFIRRCFLDSVVGSYLSRISVGVGKLCRRVKNATPIAQPWAFITVLYFYDPAAYARRWITALTLALQDE